jgi:hypothetical protein
MLIYIYWLAWINYLLSFVDPEPDPSDTFWTTATEGL